ncbi:MAG: CDP-diacylglycerol--glycerol-3-phosphate 3-phosphatidyltransferase [Akkermansia sp.]
MFNLPNILTLSRLLLAVLFTWAMVMDSTPPSSEGQAVTGWFVCTSPYKAIALWSFVIGAITDFLDGHIARKYNLVTNFGKLMDPLADKVLVSAAIIYLSCVGMCPFWVTILIISREFLVTGLRQLAIEQGEVIAADAFGKWKTVFQLIFCILCLTHIAYGGNLPPILSHLSEGALAELTRTITLWTATALTLISAINYCWKARHLVK